MHISDRPTGVSSSEFTRISAGISIKGPAAAAAQRSAAQGDTAGVSQAARLSAQAMDLADVRLDKVAGLKAAIDSGTYHVRAADLASSMLGAAGIVNSGKHG